MFRTGSLTRFAGSIALFTIFRGNRRLRLNGSEGYNGSSFKINDLWCFLNDRDCILNWPASVYKSLKRKGSSSISLYLFASPQVQFDGISDGIRGQHPQRLA